MHAAFSQIDHRPWRIPDSPWVLQQEWRELLFLHWEVDAAFLRKQIPEGLEIDTYDGKAWIAVVPFRMRGVAPRACPKPSFISDFPEINIRTYVKKDGKPGVWFFSLDVPHRLPVWLARTFFHLPYFRAKMQVDRQAGETRYVSEVGPREFAGRYRGGAAVEAQRGSFEDWATERYCFYSVNKRGAIFRCEVQHPRWPLQQASLEIETNSMLDRFPVGERHPSQLYCEYLPVVAWWPGKC